MNSTRWLDDGDGVDDHDGDGVDDHDDEGDDDDGNHDGDGDDDHVVDYDGVGVVADDYDAWSIDCSSDVESCDCM